MSRRNNRRDFLKTSAAVGAGYWISGRAAAEDSKSPNEVVRFACIGVGGKGSSDSADAARLGEVVGACDVDSKRLDAGLKRWPNAKGYADYRKLLDEVGKNVDAVTVSTPDHTHAVATAMALRMGKACFTQKPLTHTIYEARKLGELAREMKVATQMGNQGTASNSLRKTAAVIRAGAVGSVTEVHVWTNRPIWPQGGTLPEEKPVPEHLNWDCWLGPAQARPYGEGYHPFAWRGWWDFGTGALGDMACHTVNMPFMALNLRDPIAVQAESSGHNQQSYPKWSVITYEFPSNDNRGAVKMKWYDGGKRVTPDLLDGEQPAPSGVLIVGDKGKLYAPGDYCEKGYKLLGSASDKEVEFPNSPGHFEEFVRAVKGGEPAMSNFPDYAAPLTETILLGNLAVWAAPTADTPGKRIDWDAKNLKATNAPEVDSVVKTTYREGYTL